MSCLFNWFVIYRIGKLSCCLPGFTCSSQTGSANGWHIAGICQTSHWSSSGQANRIAIHQHFHSPAIWESPPGVSINSDVFSLPSFYGDTLCRKYVGYHPLFVTTYSCISKIVTVHVLVFYYSCCKLGRLFKI